MATRRNILAGFRRAPGEQKMLFRKLSARIINGIKAVDQEVQKTKAGKAQPATQETLPG
jgi:hypothetical protein